MTTPQTTIKALIESEFDTFFEFPGADKAHVTSVSCKLFAEHIAALSRPAVAQPLTEAKALSPDAISHAINQAYINAISDTSPERSVMHSFARCLWSQWCVQYAARPANDIDEAHMARLTERGAVAWAGVDPAELRGAQPAAPVARPVPYFNRLAVERAIESCENPEGMRLNDSKERPILPGGTLRRLLDVIDALSAQPAAVGAMKDHEIAELVNTLRDIAIEFAGQQQLRERIAHAVVPALKRTSAVGAVPEIDYDALIKASTAKGWRQGKIGCAAFARGAEWFRDQMLSASPQPKEPTA